MSACQYMIVMRPLHMRSIILHRFTPSIARPMEISSKKRPGPVRHVIQESKRVRRDPRYDDLSGTLNMGLFRKTYSFIEDKAKQDMAALEKCTLEKDRAEKRGRRVSG